MRLARQTRAPSGELSNRAIRICRAERNSQTQAAYHAPLTYSKSLFAQAEF